MGLRQVEQGFSSFFAKVLAYLKIFQSGAPIMNHLYANILAKIEEKPRFTCLKPIFRQVPGTRKQ